MDDIKDSLGTKIQGHLIIRDPESGKVLVNKPIRNEKASK